MRYVSILLILFITFSMQSMSQIENLKEDIIFSDDILGTSDEIWTALLMTLEEDSLKATYIDHDKGSVNTAYFYLPSKLMDSYVGTRLSYMSKFDNWASIWEQIRYSFNISIVEKDSSLSIIYVNTTLQVFESNSTKVWHSFESNGIIEKSLLTNLKKNLNKLRNGKSEIIHDEKYLLFDHGNTSCQIELMFERNMDDVWIVLQKMINNNSISLVLENRNLGIMTTEFIPLGEDQVDIVATNDMLNPLTGWDKSMSIWTDLYRIAFSLNVSTLSEDASKTRVLIQTYIERYESNTTESWHRVKSTGGYENTLSSFLISAMAVFDQIDRNIYINLHLDTVVSCTYNETILSVLNSSLRSIQVSNFKIKSFSVDSGITIGTHYKPINNSYLSLGLFIQKLSPQKTKVSIVASERLDNPIKPTIGIKYVSASNIQIDSFLKNMESELTNVSLLELQKNQYIVTTLYNYLSSDSAIDSFSNEIRIYKQVSLIPGYEIFDRGIRIVNNNGKLNILISGYITVPFEFKNTPYLSQLSELFFQRFIFNLAHSLSYKIEDIQKFHSIIFETDLKVYILDDKTPINNSYRKLRIEVKIENLLSMLSFETSLKDLIQSSIISFNGKKIKT